MKPETLFNANQGLAVAIATRGRFFAPKGTDTGDLIQEARLGLWDAAQSYDPARSRHFRAWAARIIVKRLSYWVGVQQGREVRYERAQAAAVEWEATLEPWREPDFDGQMRLAVVWRRLTPRHRAVLLLCVGYGYTTGDLARAWGLTPKQADNLLAKARRAALREAGAAQPEGPKTLKPCATCGTPANPLRRGRCGRCDKHLWRYGAEYPQRGAGVAR